jgi:type IV secretory pathway TrbF-like protein
MMKAGDKLKSFLSFSNADKNIPKGTENPYLNARRTWNHMMAGLIASTRMWQCIGLLALFISVACVGGMIHIGSQSKFIPLVFQQDADGNTISVTRADQVQPAKIADFRTAVANFITHIRLVTPDTELQRKAIFQVYSYLSEEDPATQKATEYLNGSQESNPFNRAINETVDVEIRSVLQQTKSTWQVDWLETVRNRDGSLKEPPYLMRALVTIYQSEPSSNTTNIEALRNPHFIFVRDFNWSKQM